MHAAKSLLLLLFITLSLATVNTTEESSVADSEQSKAAVEESRTEAEPTASTPTANEADAKQSKSSVDAKPSEEEQHEETPTANEADAEQSELLVQEIINDEIAATDDLRKPGSEKLEALFKKLLLEVANDANFGIKKPSTFLGTYAWMLLSDKLESFIVFYLVDNEDHENIFKELADTFRETYFVRVDFSSIVGKQMKTLDSKTYPVISCHKFKKSLPAISSKDKEELKRIINEVKDLNLADFEEYVAQIKGDKCVAGAVKPGVKRAVKPAAGAAEELLIKAIAAELEAAGFESHDFDEKLEETSNVSPADGMKLDASSNVSPAVDTKLEATSNLSPADDTELEEGSKGSHGN